MTILDIFKWCRKNDGEFSIMDDPKHRATLLSLRSGQLRADLRLSHVEMAAAWQQDRFVEDYIDRLMRELDRAKSVEPGAGI